MARENCRVVAPTDYKGLYVVVITTLRQTKKGKEIEERYRSNPASLAACVDQCVTYNRRTKSELAYVTIEAIQHGNVKT